ncbi:MAG: 23S rRNA (uracil(1939)-C(5))-methyltransferase RlmD [Neisseria sp.]|uniref:23S rRNA (uracil(1939)-C(5))-methyltransferase RlmD n=1 Tax=Neisseria sp. TaxID=192066 RepID=UPI0026DC5CD3|nr:23S rRNA (uracil(1939)-C(5))-methyltransferase RlmD [Neisseria sp.]MDO4642121.1 23S rRNA (uracil(1939)-C(5))-methyltransferase RlmD [Neisseria sp.]
MRERVDNNRALVFAIDYEGRGVAKVDGKTVFIRGALPYEEVEFRVVRSKKHFDEAEVTEIHTPSSDRVEPKCRHFGECGGCVLQHASAEAQVAYKQRIMEEQLLHIGKVKPEHILPPIYAQPWGYRHRARLSVKRKSAGRVMLGFKSRRSNEVVDLTMCPVLPQKIDRLFDPLRHLLQSLSPEAEIEAVEFLVGEAVTVLNICSVKSLSEKDLQRLKKFSDEFLSCGAEPWQIWLQVRKAKARPFYPKNMPDLFYTLSEFDIKMPFRPGDFTQINQDVNALMISRAMRMLGPHAEERIGDLFCGLGNFTLPLAKTGAQVLGIEGADYLVDRAVKSAEVNGCSENTYFEVADLFTTKEATVARWGKLDKMLLDPPRSGAYEVVKALQGQFMPERIVYVSCNPATFARDANVIIKKGYKFKEVGVMNMFPQTAHVESVGLFLR